MTAKELQDSKISASEFCHITTSAAHFLKNHPNWKTYWNSRHGTHHFYIVYGAYVLVNCWNVNNFCAVYIVPENGTPPKTVCNHSTSWCNSGCKPWIPKDWICVYSSGTWKMPGVWEIMVQDILEKIEEDVRWIKIENEIKKQISLRNTRLQHKVDYERAVAAVK